MPRFHTYYDNLKVPRTASPEVIRAAYRRLSQKHHPDRNPDNPESARVMVLLNIAYRALSDPAKRAEHDRWIAQQEAAAEALRPQWQEPQTPPPPPPPPPRRPRSPPKYRPAERDGPYFSETARQGIRIAFVFLASLLIGVPVLASIAALWELPPMPADRPASRPEARAKTANPYTRPLVQIRPLDPSGIYRLVKSDFRFEDGKPVVYSKGKLEIRRMRENTYLILDAKTIPDTGTHGDAHVYHLRPGRYAFDKLELHRNDRNWAVLEGDQLVKHASGVNFEEITWWRRVPEGYSEKYLDREIKEAEWVYKVRVEKWGAEK